MYYSNWFNKQPTGQEEVRQEEVRQEIQTKRMLGGRRAALPAKQKKQELNIAVLEKVPPCGRSEIRNAG